MNGNEQTNRVHEACGMGCYWGKLWEKCKQFDLHIHEGEKEGGFRDRLLTLEGEVKVIKEEKLNTTKNAQWRIGIIVGILCSLPAWIGLMMRLFGK